MTPEEYNKLVFDVTEKVLLRVPEVLGNLMQNHAEMNRLNKDFYNTYPEFKRDPIVVRSVIQEIEQANPAILHEDLLKLAGPKIKERMHLTSTLDTIKVRKKDQLNLSADFNGEI